MSLLFSEHGYSLCPCGMWFKCKQSFRYMFCCGLGGKVCVCFREREIVKKYFSQRFVCLPVLFSFSANKLVAKFKVSNGKTEVKLL